MKKSIVISEIAALISTLTEWMLGIAIMGFIFILLFAPVFYPILSARVKSIASGRTNASVEEIVEARNNLKDLKRGLWYIAVISWTLLIIINVTWNWN